MFCLTSRERKALLFIASLLILGASLRYLRYNYNFLVFKDPFLEELDKDPTENLTFPININKAGLSELESLPGIGKTYAQRIIEYRTHLGPFKKIEDLEGVKGIGKKRLEELKKYISF